LSVVGSLVFPSWCALSYDDRQMWDNRQAAPRPAQN
jgi:hypothetical protein